MITMCIFIAIIAVWAAIVAICLSKNGLQQKLEKVLPIYNCISILVALINTTFVSSLVCIIFSKQNRAFLLAELFQIIVIGALFFNAYGENVISKQVLMVKPTTANAELEQTYRKYIQQLFEQGHFLGYRRPAIDYAQSDTPYFISLSPYYFVASTNFDELLARKPAWLDSLPMEVFSWATVSMRNAAFLSIWIITLILRIPEGICFLLDSVVKGIYGLICAIAQSYDDSPVDSFVLAYQAAGKHIRLHSFINYVIVKFASFSVDKIVRYIFFSTAI